jgi:DMSO/TMAO reductase YedYZ molybdopterin-dependent catalytic subunit
MVHNKMSRRSILRLGALSIGSMILSACQNAVGAVTNNSPAPAQAPAAPGAISITSPKPAANLSTQAGTVPVTANQDFYTVSIGNDPRQVPADWKFSITGQVDKPLTFTLDQLKALPSVTEMRSLMCISNPVGGDLTGNAVWKGVQLKDLLAQAGVKSSAGFLKLESFDGFSTSIPLDLAKDDHALLVYEMNGDPLPIEHGAPLRSLWPGRYGMKQPKWLQTLTLIDTEYSGYWERQGWSNEARIRPFSRIDSPPDLTPITGATFTLSGIAFSNETGLAKLEIGWDAADPMQPAELTRGPSPYVWTAWQWTGNVLPPGKHTLYARATDGKGQAQTRAQALNLLGGTFPNGTDDMQSIVLDFKG